MSLNVRIWRAGPLAMPAARAVSPRSIPTCGRRAKAKARTRGTIGKDCQSRRRGRADVKAVAADAGTRENNTEVVKRQIPGGDDCPGGLPSSPGLSHFLALPPREGTALRRPVQRAGWPVSVRRTVQRRIRRASGGLGRCSVRGPNHLQPPCRPWSSQTQADGAQ